MRKFVNRVILSIIAMLSFTSLGYCIMDGPIYTENKIQYADFGVDAASGDIGANGNSCEIRIQTLPKNLIGANVTGHMVVNSYVPFSGKIFTSGGTTYQVTLGNGGGMRVPVKLHIEAGNGGGIGFIYFISDDPTSDGDALCQALAPNTFINRLKLVAEP